MDEQRLDSNDVLFFKRELESIDSRIYEVKFPLLKGKALIPKVTDVGETDNEYTYRQYTLTGKAKIISDGADDLPSVNAEGQEFTSRIKILGTKYGYNLFEIKAAAAKGKPLSDLLARAARRAIEEEIDSILAFGSSAHSMKGFVNSADVDATTFVPSTKTAGGTTWLDSGAPNATGAEMVGDVNVLVAQVWNQLKEAEGIGGKLVIVVPAAEYAYLASQPMGDNADKTALRFLTENNPFLEEIVPWHKLAGAGDSSSNRMICYVRDPQVLGALVPLEYSPQMVQQLGLKFEVPVVARCGGTVIRYPIAMAYGDGI
jgi:hypothetical protein